MDDNYYYNIRGGVMGAPGRNAAITALATAFK